MIEIVQRDERLTGTGRSAAGVVTVQASRKRLDHKQERLVIVLGQVPPPINGQSLMIEEFLAGSYPGFKLIHIPMRFSAATSEIGVAGFGKVLKLIEIVWEVYRVQRRTKAAILYYPPAGPNRVPVLRDLVILGLCRKLFRQTVFHFHAAGLAEILPRLTWPLRRLFWLAYRQPSLAIFTTAATSQEAAILGAEATAIVPSGARDYSVVVSSGDAQTTDTTVGENAVSVTAEDLGPTILFIGIVCEGKGVKTLIDACAILHRRGVRFRLVCLGDFESTGFKNEVEAMVLAAGLTSRVEFPGSVVGEAKTRRLLQADIFCFPSHYTSESFGVVLIEAMSFSLPIVATRWRGIPEVTGEEGSFLVAVQAPEQLADGLSRLIESRELRRSMGAINRIRYLERFTIAAYRDGMLRALQMLPEGV